jgi:hypothetical protein
MHFKHFLMFHDFPYFPHQPSAGCLWSSQHQQLPGCCLIRHDQRGSPVRSSSNRSLPHLAKSESNQPLSYRLWAK